MGRLQPIIEEGSRNPLVAVLGFREERLNRSSRPLAIAGQLRVQGQLERALCTFAVQGPSLGRPDRGGEEERAGEDSHPQPSHGREATSAEAPLLSFAAMLLLPALGAAVLALGANPEIRATGVVAVAGDASGAQAAAMAEALLRARVVDAPSLRLVEPGRALSGDPLTREESTRERARAALADGLSAWEALALDDAIARLGQAVSLYQKTGPLLDDLGELRRALEHLGASLVLRGSAAEGESLFVELLTLDPGHELEGFPPAVEGVFDRAAARVDALRTGSVELFSNPPQAAVFVDGRFEGVTPMVLDEVLAGRHLLRLEKLGYVLHAAPLEVTAGKTVTLQARLRSLGRGAELRDRARRAERETRETPNASMGGQARELARLLKADTLILVSCTQSRRDATFVTAVFEASSGLRRATERTVLSTDTPDYAENLARYLDRVLAAASDPTTSLGSDTGEASKDGTRPFGLGGESTPPPRLSAQGQARATPPEILVGWTLVGVGGVALLTGAGFGVAAQITHDDFRNTPQGSPELSDLQDQGRTYSNLADGLLIGGGVLALGGAALVLFSDAFRGSPFRAGVQLGTDRAIVKVGGAF